MRYHPSSGVLAHTTRECHHFIALSTLPSALLFLLSAYLVYEVYSWDVMEPATYFLMVRLAAGLHGGVVGVNQSSCTIARNPHRFGTTEKLVATPFAKRDTKY